MFKGALPQSQHAVQVAAVFYQGDALHAHTRTDKY